MIATAIALCLTVQTRSICGYVRRVDGIVKLKSGANFRVLSSKDLNYMVRYGDYVLTGKSGTLHIALTNRPPTIFDPSPSWQLVQQARTALHQGMKRAMQERIATAGSKAEATAIIANLAYGFAVHLRNTRGPVSGRIEQLGLTLWEGTLYGDPFGDYRNSAIGPKLAGATRTSDLIMTVGGSKPIKFRLLSKNQEARLLNELEKANAAVDPDHARWLRYEAYKKVSFGVLASREAALLGIGP